MPCRPCWSLSLLLEGPAAIAAGLARATPLTWAAVLWQSVGNTMFGYACWAWLLSRYPAATIAPVSLLVPVFGFAASALLLHEPMPLEDRRHPVDHGGAGGESAVASAQKGDAR